MSKVYFLVISLFLLAGCGVKGDPTPPEKPPVLGRGKPNYKKATEGIRFPTMPPEMAEEEEEEEDEDEDDEDEE